MALTLLNLNNRFPQWGDKGFTPQKLSGTITGLPGQ